MAGWGRAALVGLVLLLVGCAGTPAPAARESGAQQPQAAPAPKRVVAAVMSEPAILSWKLSAGDNLRAGLDTLEPLVHVGLVTTDNQGQLRPLLAEAAPTIENGLWKLLPDGRMETTWKLRSNALWHDGTPVTGDDLVFTDTVQQDPAMAAFRDGRYQYIERVTAPDARTVTVTWKRPFIDADQLFSNDLGLPLPKHILGQAYLDSKETIADLPYWADEFVGTGPFKVRQFTRGQGVILDANEQYVLGRPKLDTIEVRFILDSNTLVANILSEAVELTLGRNISVEQSLLVRDQWRGGRIEVAPVNLVRAIPQFVNPQPESLGDVRMRRGLLHAIDRQEIVDTLQAGVTPMAHSFMDPNQPAYRDIEAKYLVRYDFDPRRAAQLIEEVGHTKGPDGIYRDAVGRPLSVDVLVSASQEINVKTAFAVADYWQKVGVAAKAIVEPTQMTGAERREYEAARPAFFVTRQGGDTGGFPRLYSSEAPLAENRFVGSNAARYMSASLDNLLDRYYTTIPRPERLEVIGGIIHELSDQLVLLPLYYGAEPAVIGNRLANVGLKTTGSMASWNANEWDLK
jgi:peptide/nickel transport system substrate-binding protein